MVRFVAGKDKVQLDGLGNSGAHKLVAERGGHGRNKGQGAQLHGGRSLSWGLRTLVSGEPCYC